MRQDLSQVDANAPLRLSEAARLAFPDGSMTATALRRERDKGRLVTERICGRDYTTLANIMEMRKLCRVSPREPISTSNPPAPAAAKLSPPAGPSATVDTNSAYLSLKANLNKHNKPSPGTSSANTTPVSSATVILHPSRSRMSSKST